MSVETTKNLRKFGRVATVSVTMLMLHVYLTKVGKKLLQYFSIMGLPREGKGCHFDFFVTIEVHMYMVFATLVVAKVPPRETKNLFSFAKDNSQGGV